MIAYPNSGNISLFLLRVKTDADDLGNQVLRLVGSKEVVGVTSSITSKEYYQSKESKVQLDFKVSIQAFLYDRSKFIYIPKEDTIYKVERTYQNGIWLELSVSETNLKKEEILQIKENIEKVGRDRLANDEEEVYIFWLPERSFMR